MNQVREQEISRYIGHIRRLLPVYKEEEKQFINGLELEIKTFIENHQDSSFDEVVAQFQTPQQVVCDYLSSLDYSRLWRMLSLRKHIKKLIGLLLILAVLSCSAYLFLIRMVSYNYDHTPVFRFWNIESAAEENHE